MHISFASVAVTSAVLETSNQNVFDRNGARESMNDAFSTENFLITWSSNSVLGSSIEHAAAR